MAMPLNNDLYFPLQVKNSLGLINSLILF